MLLIGLATGLATQNFGGNFRRQKENLRNFREKLTNSRILEQFELSPDMLATFHKQKR